MPASGDLKSSRRSFFTTPPPPTQTPGIDFKISDEHLHPFHMRSPPPEKNVSEEEELRQRESI